MTISQRCYDPAQEIVYIFEGGELEKKLKSEDAVLTMHASYFDFLYKDVQNMEEEVFQLLKHLIEKRIRKMMRDKRKFWCKMTMFWKR